MPDEISAVQAVGGTGAIAVLAGALYRIFRIVKEDRRSDAKDKRVDEWSDKLMHRVEELEKRVDLMAEERNAALAKASQLEGVVALLQKEVDDLKADLLAEKNHSAKLKAAANKSLSSRRSTDG